MRTSKFYEVVNTLDKMREVMDKSCQSNTKLTIKENLQDLIKDLAKITGTNSTVTKILNEKKIDNSQYRILSKGMSRKWGELKNPTDPKTIQFMTEMAGILRLYKADVFDLSRKNREFRNLEKILPEQRRLVLCDDTYRSIERYVFFLRGYGNVLMGMMIGAGTCDINSILTPEEKAQFANFIDGKNIFLTNMLKEITLSIDKFIMHDPKLVIA